MDYANARARYLRGDIEIEEFEACLDTLVKENPDAIGQCGDPLPERPVYTDEPGAIVPYNPTFETPQWFMRSIGSASGDLPDPELKAAYFKKRAA